MTPDGFARALRAFARRRPFGTFVIEMVSGDQLEVRHPEAVHIRDNVVLFIDVDRQQRLFDSTSVCQLREATPTIPGKPS